MSLLVWLPLDGNLNNQGLSPAKFTMVNSSGGLSVASTGGKISQSCYQRTTRETADYITSDRNFLLDGDMSMCCWCKVTSYGTTNSANGIITHHGHNTGGLGITMRYVSATDYRMSINTGVKGDSEGSSDRTYMTYYSTTNIYNKWHHLCVTFNKTQKKIQMYIDGKLETIVGYGTSLNLDNDAATARPFQLFSWSTDHASSASYRPPCLLNDVRLYNHCLSPKEVAEIAKGLIAHWPLRDGINDNLITTMSSGGRTTLNGKYGLNADYAQNLDTYGYFNVSPALMLGQKYTLSFDVENFPEDGAAWGWQLWNNANYSFSVTGNGHYTYTFTPVASKLPANYSLTQFLFDDGGRTRPAKMVKFLNFKIERSETDTTWCPHTSDTSATFARPNYTMDCSGYGYKMAQVGAASGIDTDKSGGRGKNCYYFYDGKTYYFRSDNCFFPYEEVTMSCWFKGSSGIAGSSNYHIPFASASGYFEISLEGTTGLLRGGCYVNDTRACKTTDKAVIDNNWHMLTITFNGTHVRYYVDGVEIPNSAYAITGTLSGGGKRIATIGHYGTDSNYGNKNCYMSDVRLYSTALSAADILELYQTSAYVDSNSRICAYEFIENNNSSLEKTGAFMANVASGLPIQDMKIKALSDGSMWARIFWHDVTNVKTWFTTSDAKDCINAENKYSRMGLVDKFKTASGTYEFMLTYPRLSTTLYNRWYQTSSPEAATVTGYKAVHIDWTAHSGGIRKNGSSSYWNCDTGSTWYAALGQYVEWSGGIPGADSNPQTETELWVRIDNLTPEKVVAQIGNDMIMADIFDEI